MPEYGVVIEIVEVLDIKAEADNEEEARHIASETYLNAGTEDFEFIQGDHSIISSTELPDG